MAGNSPRTRPQPGFKLFHLIVILAAVFPTEAISQPDSLRVMPLGDSITHAYDGHAGYRYWLWQDLETAGHAVNFVGSNWGVWKGEAPYSDYDQDHEGHWGWRTDQILDSLGTWVAANPPDLVLIHLGHNDLWQGQSVDGTLDELGQVIDEVRVVNPTTVFLVAQIIPATYSALDSIVPFNARIPDLAEAKHTSASPVLVVDQHTGFDPLLHTYDNVHPNEAGEQLMAERWFAPLDSLLVNVSAVGPPASGTGFRLKGFPNPFNPTTVISYTLPAAGAVRISIHTLEGRRVTTLVDGHREAGDHALTWHGRDGDGRDVASGVYFVRFSSSGQQQIDKVTLIR